MEDKVHLGKYSFKDEMIKLLIDKEEYEMAAIMRDYKLFFNAFGFPPNCTKVTFYNPFKQNENGTI